MRILCLEILWIGFGFKKDKQWKQRATKGLKIEAIKAMREAYPGRGLKEAKEAVEAYMAKLEQKGR